MRSVMFFVVANLLCVTQAIAEERRPIIFPVMGYAEGDLLYVRTYRSEHERIPEQLFAYGDGKEFVGKLRKTNSFLAEPSGERRGCYDDTYKGRFVYETQQKTGMTKALVFDDKKKIYKMIPNQKRVKVLVFDTKRDIRSGNNKWIDEDSRTGWEIFRLTSNEGSHEIVRVQEGGKCVGNIDYYTYCDYDTEADSREAFDAAMCGKQIDGSDIGF